MPANYDLSDLQPLLPFAATDDGAPFPWQADAGGGYVLYLADDKGLWLRVPGERDDAMDFEAVTRFRQSELERKKAGGIYIYTLKGGAPLLPFPFTAAQLVELDERTDRVFSERIRCGDETRALIAEIAQLYPKSAELARAVVYGELPPEQATTPAPAAGAASNAPEPLQTAPAPVEPPSTVMKRKALIAHLEHEWPTIEADLSEATRNGLKDAAATGKHGKWYVEKARAWAQQEGKLKQAAPAHPLASAWAGAITRNRP